MGALIASLIPAAIGAVGSIIGGNKAAAGENAGAQTALTGYNYLKGNPLINAAQTAGQGALSGVTADQSALAQLLGLAPATPGTQSAFQNYLNSTGYQFQLGQGDAAITDSASSRGILNSGDTAKALTRYGQNLASGSFTNYLGQIAGLNGLQQATANSGLTAAQLVGQAGTTGGGIAGQLQAQAGQSQGTAFAQAANYLGGGLSAGGGLASLFGGGGGGSASPVNNATSANFLNTGAFQQPFDFSNVSSYVPSGF